MRYILLTLLIASVAALFVGCGGSKTLQGVSEGDIPDWYKQPPASDQNFFYAANSQSSQDMQLAVDKATNGARTAIAQQVDVKVTGLQKKFEEETGKQLDAQLLQMFSQATKQVVSTSLSGCSVKEQKIAKDGDMWRAYVLMQYPVGAASEAMQKQIKNNELMKTQLQESKMMKDLDQEVQKYEEGKKQQ